MSINGNANADIYRECIAGDTESNETTPLLSNGTVQSRAKGASSALCVFNLMNAIMGSGILGLAYAMASTGIVGFCILLVLVSSLAAYSIHLLLKLCDHTGINSYEDLGGRALQKPGKVLVGIVIVIQNIGGPFCLETHVILLVHLEVGASCSHQQLPEPRQPRRCLV